MTNKQKQYNYFIYQDKNKKVKSLKDAWEGSPTLKNGILSATKANLLHIANKNFVDNSLVHAVLLEYMCECSEEDRKEMIAAYTQHIPAISSTKEGAQVACLAYLQYVEFLLNYSSKMLIDFYFKLKLGGQGASSYIESHQRPHRETMCA